MIKKILQKVKQNKKYKSISDDIVLSEIKVYLESHPKTELNKDTIKDIRAQLHKTYSSFQTKKKKKKYQYLEEFKNAKTKKQILEITNKLLSITLSTKERLKDYQKLYKQIFKITGKPKIIFDLGAGLNPLSFPYMELSELTYYSYDINEEDVKFLNNYFKIMQTKGLKGKAKIINIQDYKKISQLPYADIILIFKLIDIIDKKNHKPSEQLITQLLKNKKTKFIIASFATKTLTRKKMNFPKRKWFELMLKRNYLFFKTIETDNEIFYIINQ